uniref:THAP-type domain-containing protein n=1 Tax=Lygus hesperus TaxID=30085 RepID=A0A146L0D5_LYGHE
MPDGEVCQIERGRPVLSKGAVPSIFPERLEMVASVCFVPHCKTGYNSEITKNKKEGIPNPPLYQFPRDPEMFSKWARQIKGRDRKPTVTDRICARHFQSECISRFFETKLSNGTVDRIERLRPCLKRGAIPTIFPNPPNRLIF